MAVLIFEIMDMDPDLECENERELYELQKEVGLALSEAVNEGFLLCK